MRMRTLFALAALVRVELDGGGEGAAFSHMACPLSVQRL